MGYRQKRQNQPNDVPFVSWKRVKSAVQSGIVLPLFLGSAKIIITLSSDDVGNIIPCLNVEVKKNYKKL
jgi:hypothetical protein